MDRNQTFDQVLRLEPGQATLDIFRRAFARVVSAKEVADELALW